MLAGFTLLLAGQRGQGGDGGEDLRGVENPLQETCFIAAKCA